MKPGSFCVFAVESLYNAGLPRRGNFIAIQANFCEIFWRVSQCADHRVFLFFKNVFYVFVLHFYFSLFFNLSQVFFWFSNVFYYFVFSSIIFYLTFSVFSPGRLASAISVITDCTPRSAASIHGIFLMFQWNVHVRRTARLVHIYVLARCDRSHRSASAWTKVDFDIEFIRGLKILSTKVDSFIVS